MDSLIFALLTHHFHEETKKKTMELKVRVADYLADIRTSDRRNTGLVLCRCTEPFRELFPLRSTFVFTFHLRLDFPSVVLACLSDQLFVSSTLAIH